MGRSPRITEPGWVYHVLNRRAMRLRLFESDGDFAAFLRILQESLERPDAPRLLAYCVMPNHWHLVVQARPATSLSTWMHWVTVTHTHRWHAYRKCVGEGPLYQGRFKSFPVQSDTHFVLLCRYVEGNALRARLVRSAESWRYGSLWLREAGPAADREMLAPWPVTRPRQWVQAVNRLLNEAQLGEMRQAIARGRPLGTENWVAKAAARHGLEATVRPRGRPRKDVDDQKST